MSQESELTHCCELILEDAKEMIGEYIRLLKINKIPISLKLCCQFILTYLELFVDKVFQTDKKIILYLIEETKKQKSTALIFIDTVTSLDKDNIAQQKAKELLQKEGITFVYAVKIFQLVNPEILRAQPDVDADNLDFFSLSCYPQAKQLVENYANKTWRTLHQKLNDRETMKGVLLISFTKGILLACLMIAGGDEESMDKFITVLTTILNQASEYALHGKPTIN